MIISEKQIMQLMDIAQEYAIKLTDRTSNELSYALHISKIVREIKEQQSQELKEIE